MWLTDVFLTVLDNNGQCDTESWAISDFLDDWFFFNGEICLALRKHQTSHTINSLSSLWLRRTVKWTNIRSKNMDEREKRISLTSKQKRAGASRCGMSVGWDSVDRLFSEIYWTFVFLQIMSVIPLEPPVQLYLFTISTAVGVRGKVLFNVNTITLRWSEQQFPLLFTVLCKQDRTARCFTWDWCTRDNRLCSRRWGVPGRLQRRSHSGLHRDHMDDTGAPCIDPVGAATAS